MSDSPWYLRRGAVWKRAAVGSHVYLPSACLTVTLNEETTDLLASLENGHYADPLPAALNDLVHAGMLTRRMEEGRQLVMNRAEPRLDYVVLRLTNACNLRCRHCFVASGEPEPNELSLTEVGALFDALDEFNPLVVVLTGGEPLLRPDIFDVAELAADHHMAVDLSTNGLLLNKACLERLSRLPNLRYVIVSLEGPSPNIHDYVRGAGNFEATVVLIRTLVEWGIPVSVNHCVSAFNLPYLSATIDLALELGVKSVHVAMVSESGRARQHWSQFAMTEEQRRTATLISLRKFLESGKVFAGEAEREVTALGETPTERDNCGAGYDWCMIYANGDVAPCRPVYAAVGAAGNVRQQPFDVIWRTAPLLNRLRTIRAEDIGRCKLCYWVSRCRAGCRAYAYMASGSWTAPQSESFCQDYRFLNAEIQRACLLWYAQTSSQEGEHGAQQ